MADVPDDLPDWAKELDDNRTEFQKRYHQHLRTHYWSEVRALVFARDGHECRYCHGSKNLEVHHVHYGFVFREKQGLHTLLTLCHHCHQTHHDFMNAAKNLS